MPNILQQDQTANGLATHAEAYVGSSLGLTPLPLVEGQGTRTTAHGKSTTTDTWLQHTFEGPYNPYDDAAEQGKMVSQGPHHNPYPTFATLQHASPAPSPIEAAPHASMQSSHATTHAYHPPNSVHSTGPTPTMQSPPPVRIGAPQTSTLESPSPMQPHAVLRTAPYVNYIDTRHAALGAHMGSTGAASLSTHPVWMSHGTLTESPLVTQGGAWLDTPPPASHVTHRNSLRASVGESATAAAAAAQQKAENLQVGLLCNGGYWAVCEGRHYAIVTLIHYAIATLIHYSR